ncbi:uncharacterized protein FOMMEDRAFT_84016, partial [Fomitiporia mediterranea MF3/22]|uniref:uncharacterized protein n=1 Tax=Fomitiporia mediterranea (strain MF3/22) TaxID=694068 RepID=UPI0004408F1C
SEPNEYKLLQEYLDLPDDFPDKTLNLEDLCNLPRLSTVDALTQTSSLPKLITNKYVLFNNVATYLLTSWANCKVKEKTNNKLDVLVHKVLLYPDFKLLDLVDYRARWENSHIDSLHHNNDSPESSHSDDWCEGSVKIKLPPEDNKKWPGGKERAPEFEVRGIHYWPLLTTIFKALDNPCSPPFHYMPYRELWRLTVCHDSSPEHIYSELYCSDYWLEAYKEVQSFPTQDSAENFVLPLILYSDSTHLANFGSASLWLIYMYFGG